MLDLNNTQYSARKASEFLADKARARLADGDLLLVWADELAEASVTDVCELLAAKGVRVTETPEGDLQLAD